MIAPGISCDSSISLGGARSFLGGILTEIFQTSREESEAGDQRIRREAILGRTAIARNESQWGAAARSHWVVLAECVRGGDSVCF